MAVLYTLQRVLEVGPVVLYKEKVLEVTIPFHVISPVKPTSLQCGIHTNMLVCNEAFYCFVRKRTNSNVSVDSQSSSKDGDLISEN